MLICFASSSSSQTNYYNTKWQEVEKLEREGLTKSASNLVDKIFENAKNDKDATQSIKALIHQSKYLQVLEEDSQLKIVTNFKSEIETSDTVTKHLLENLLANLYWQYFQQNRYKFYNRSKTDKKVSDDFRTWDLETLFTEIHRYFQCSLQNGLLLQQETLDNYKTLLIEVEGSKVYRPTLYDFLSYNALDFYKTSENSITQPAYKFAIDSPEYIAPNNIFINVDISSKDSVSLQFNALKIYQSLLRFHQKDKTSKAFVSANIERLKFVKQNATFDKIEDKILNTYQAELAPLKDIPISGLYSFEIANTVYNKGLQYNPNFDNGAKENSRWKNKEAISICDGIIAKFPKSDGALKCEVLKARILQPGLSLKTERYLPIDKPALILVNYKNLNQLEFDIHKVSLSKLKAFNKIYRSKEKEKFISKLRVHKSFNSKFKDEGDYQNHSTEVVLPRLENGLYIIVAKTNTDVFAVTDIQVTNLALVETYQNKKIIYRVINRNNGAPIANADAKINYINNRNQSKELSKDFTTDEYGKFYFDKDNGYYNSVYITVKNKNDTGIFGETYINRFYKQRGNTSTNYNTFLFTDRSIYRPGQTVYFKGIITKTINKKTSVIANETIIAALHNVNNEKVSELNFITNEYGSFSGEFIVPNNGLTGNFSIKTSSKAIGIRTHYFSVEEYKRPKFETNFIPVTKTYKVNDSVTVRGNAIAFAGSNITDAKVVYRVKRQVQMPRWYYWSRPSYNSAAQETTYGKTNTDNKGKFEITFKAIPDESVSKDNLPVFNYEITADVTDINGETRSKTTIVRVGYHALTANIIAPQRIDKSEKETELSLITSNLNGEFAPAKGSLKIYKLNAPDYVLRNRPWQAPDYKLLDKETFKLKFPHWSYDDEANIQNWKKGKVVFETNFDTETSKSIVLKRTKKWNSGSYIIELESKDKFGQVVKDQAFTYLISDADNTLADNKLFDISLDKAKYNSGETAVLTLGSSAKDVNVTIEIEKDGKLIKTQIHQLNDSKKTIKFPIAKSDIGGFVVHYSFSAFNDFKTGSLNINVPYPKTDLQIETSTFRDKLQPGQEETWQFKIKGPKGDKVAAEVLASMYDASLDEFKGHNWSFNPISRPSYVSQSYKNSSHSYSYANFRRYNSFKGIPSYPNQSFDRLNWFGFYFGNESYLRRQYIRKASTQKTIVSSEYKPSIKKGVIKGNIVDYKGLSIPGANIIIKGTANGSQSDFDGNFEINAKKGDVLVVSYVGFKTYEYKITKDNYVYIKLAEDFATLDEVVITGYSGAKKSAKVSSALSTVSDESFLSESEISIGKGSGQPEESAEIILRNETISNKQIKIRKNLQETAFFFPQLKTDKDGNVSFNFKAPEALTKWKLQLLAHTKTLESTVSQFEAMTQKELMVIPNASRFLRQGDEIVINTKIANLTDKPISGQAQLVLEDVVTGKDITKKLVWSSAVETFSVDKQGNTQASWVLNIPDNMQAVQYKIIAQSEDFSDGEQNILPVLTNRMLVTETLPMWVRSNETKTFTLDKLKDNTSSTLNNHKLTLEITSNPAWYAVQALSYLMEYPYDCNEQTFSRYYANALAQHITQSNPRIQEVFNQWRLRQAQSNKSLTLGALLSNLEKNQELKSLLIQETPWLRDAQSETEQKKRTALLFDLNKMNNELQSSIRKLKNNQHSTGAWPWFNGGRDNRYITQHIVSGFGHLSKLGVIPMERSDEESQMIKKAIKYLDREFVKEYKNLKKYNSKIDLNKDHLSYTQMHYLYVRSFYPEIKPSNEVNKIMDYYKGQIQKYWLKRSLYAKGLMALTMHRSDDKTTSNKILKSLAENSITSDELGMYWKSNTASWYWYKAPIETQALLIEAFSEIENKTETIDNLKIWLLKNKQTNNWETTKATADAVYALLLQGSEWLSVTEAVDVTVGDESISPEELENVKVEAGTGYYKTSWNGNDVKPKQAKVTLSKKGKGIAWGALYWQYFEDLDKITLAKTPLKLQKKLFLKKNTDRGEEILEITKDTKLNVGDLVKVRIELLSDRDMEFLHLKDMRAAGFEPINVFSQYKWQESLGYYESTKDAATNFFIDYLPKGVYVFEYDLRINNAGNMSNGITTIQSMYAPEFSSHSEGIRVKID